MCKYSALIWATIKQYLLLWMQCQSALRIYEAQNALIYINSLHLPKIMVLNPWHAKKHLRKLGKIHIPSLHSQKVLLSKYGRWTENRVPTWTDIILRTCASLNTGDNIAESKKEPFLQVQRLWCVGNRPETFLPILNTFSIPPSPAEWWTCPLSCIMWTLWPN